MLHAILKTVIFIGDFDAALVKSVEDELVLKIMGQYEASRCDARGVAPALGAAATATTTSARTTHAIAHEFVEHLVDDVSAGVEIAKMTERMLGIFKVRLLTVRPTHSCYCHYSVSHTLVCYAHTPDGAQSHASIHSPTFCTDFAAAMAESIDTVVRTTTALPL